MNDVPNAPKTVPARTASFDTSAPLAWIRNEIDRLFEDFGRPARSAFNFSPRIAAPVPAIEFAEDKGAYRLTAELPGLTDKDVEIEVADGVLTLSGEKKEEEERKKDGYLLSERSYGAFKRQITLPTDVNPDGITAAFKDGILIITLAKDEKAAARTRKISIAH